MKMLPRDAAGEPSNRAPPGFRRRGRPIATGAAVFLLLGMLYALVLFLSANGAGLPQAQLVALPPIAAPAPTTLIYENGSALAQSNASAAAAPVDATDTPSTTTTTNALALEVTSNPATICADNVSDCPAGVSQARVTLSAQAINTPKPFWPDVQVAFILETTAYDGVFDHYNSFYGQDPCAAATDGQGPVCEESNGVPFFIQYGGAVAQAIQ
jgi:hypothetical protein